MPDSRPLPGLGHNGAPDEPSTSEKWDILYLLWVQAQLQDMHARRSRKYRSMYDARPGDTLDDLFPGSGAVAAAWAEWCGDRSPLPALPLEMARAGRIPAR